MRITDRVGNGFVRVARRVDTLWSRYSNPITPNDFRNALDCVTNGGVRILLVHSSLSACGRFTAGVGDVVGGLVEVCDTLVMPTHTYCYPAAPGLEGPLFDAMTTPSKVGIVTEEHRRRQGITRSIHATHSLAISGNCREELCEGHYMCDSPCGEGTPYSRLISQGASVLLLGVSFNSYTFFHTAEFASGSQFAMEPNCVDRLRVRDENGRQRVCLSYRQGRSPMRFAEAGTLLEAKGLVRRQSLGMGFLLFVPDAGKVHDFLVQRLRKTPDFLRKRSNGVLC
jgi:aminoglycoside N3'-acetyltransferase